MYRKKLDVDSPSSFSFWNLNISDISTNFCNISPRLVSSQDFCNTLALAREIKTDSETVILLLLKRFSSLVAKLLLNPRSFPRSLIEFQIPHRLSLVFPKFIYLSLLLHGSVKFKIKADTIIFKRKYSIFLTRFVFWKYFVFFSRSPKFLEGVNETKWHLLTQVCVVVRRRFNFLPISIQMALIRLLPWITASSCVYYDGKDNIASAGGC